MLIAHYYLPKISYEKIVNNKARCISKYITDDYLFANIKDTSENDILIKQAEYKSLITVDLPKQVISCGSEININFDIDPFRKKCLLEGLDDIALTLKKSEKIDDYELKLNKSRSWLMI